MKHIHTIHILLLTLISVLFLAYGLACGGSPSEVVTGDNGFTASLPTKGDPNLCGDYLEISDMPGATAYMCTARVVMSTVPTLAVRVQLEPTPASHSAHVDAFLISVPIPDPLPDRNTRPWYDFDVDMSTISLQLDTNHRCDSTSHPKTTEGVVHVRIAGTAKGNSVEMSGSGKIWCGVQKDFDFHLLSFITVFTL